MAIQVRRGAYDSFDPTKMLAGEWAVATDTETSKQVVWMCFAPNVVKRMGTWEDLEAELDPYKEACQSYKTQAQNSATESKSYAVGGTSSRTGEDTDNAKYYYQMTRYYSPTIATTEEIGLCKVDGETITIDDDGTIHGALTITVDSEMSETSENPLQNKVITQALENIHGASELDYDEYMENKSTYDSDDNAYVVTDAPAEDGMEADDIFYDNSTSGLSNRNVQGAIDSVNGKVTVLQTQNGSETLTTTAQTLSGAVNEIKSSLTKNNFYDDFSITDYSQTSPFLCPYDGYATVYNTSSNIGFVYAMSNSSNNKVGIGGAVGMFCVPVRKGMRLWVSGSPYIAKFNGL